MESSLLIIILVTRYFSYGFSHAELLLFFFLQIAGLLAGVSQALRKLEVLHWEFFLVNVNKSAVICGFLHIYWKNY